MNVLAAILMASASLHITVWPEGADQMTKRSYTLNCAPVSGTLPYRASAVFGCGERIVRSAARAERRALPGRVFER